MRIQVLIDPKGEKRAKKDFLSNWEELTFSESVLETEGGEKVLRIEIPDEDFKKLVGIFSSPEEAMGAFLTAAQENGWEEVPTSYVVYHADFDGSKVIAGIKTPRGISLHDQLHLEQMIQNMMRFPRVVVYSSDVLTFIKDLYPEVDSRAYVIAREIARKGFQAPSLEDLGRLYGIDVSTLEGKLNLIDRLIKEPVRLPEGEVVLRSYDLPLR